MSTLTALRSVVCRAVALRLPRPAAARLPAKQLLVPGRKASQRPPVPLRASEYNEEWEEGELEEYEVLEEDEDGYMEDDSDVLMFLDSADVREWERWADTGIFYGFTTNPTILKRDNVRCTLDSLKHLTTTAFELGAEELQLQAWGRTPEEMYACGMDLAELDDRVVVKLPITLDGLKATRRLVDDDVPVTLTGVYSPQQVLLALASGASYAAPYLGRMNDAGRNGVEDIALMQSIIDMSTNVEGEMRLLVASVRDASELAVLAGEGCNTFTISPAVADQLVNDPLTLAAAEVFQEHADEMGAMRR